MISMTIPFAQLTHQAKQVFVHQIPTIAKRVLQLVPTTPQHIAFESVLNHCFYEQITNGELDFLRGKILTLEITDLAKRYSFTVNANKIRVLAVKSHADVTMRSDLNSLVLLASSQADPDNLFFQRKLLLTGDTCLGLEFKSFVENLNLDQLPSVLQLGLKTHATWILTATN